MEGVTYWTATNIYVTPTTLSGITFNFLMSLSGGLLAGYVIAKGDPFWTYSSGLAGVICASAGNDLYHLLQAMIIGAIGVYVAYKMHYWVERKFFIDGAFGAFAYHGYAGVNPVGMIIGAIIMFGLLGFLPGYVIAKILNGMGRLRIPKEVEIAGLDFNYMEAAKADEDAVAADQK